MANLKPEVYRTNFAAEGFGGVLDVSMQHLLVLDCWRGTIAAALHMLCESGEGDWLKGSDFDRITAMVRLAARVPQNPRASRWPSSGFECVGEMRRMLDILNAVRI
nr:hypothetical protein CFP56_79330 [Quercus suber]